MRIATVDGTTKTPCVEKKVGFHNGLMVDGCGFGKSQESLIFVSTSDSSMPALKSAAKGPSTVNGFGIER